MKMLPPPTYVLRSHAQEGSIAGRRPTQASDKKEDKYAAEKMTHENIESTKVPPTIKKQNSQNVECKHSESNPPVEIPDTHQIADNKEDHTTSPSEPAELESAVVQLNQPIENQISAGESNSISDDEGNQENGFRMCPLCPSSFARSKHLTMHLKESHCVHAKICPVCNDRLSSVSSRDRHLLTHTKERPHTCEVCNKKFSTNGNMHRHWRRHMNGHLIRQMVKNKRKENRNFKQQRNLSKKVKTLAQADVSEVRKRNRGFLPEINNKEEMYSQKNYFKSLGLCRKTSNSQSNINQDFVRKSHKQGKFEKVPKQRKVHFAWGGGKMVPVPPSTTEVSDNLRRKKANENIDDEDPIANRGLIQSSYNPVYNSNPADVQDLAGITEIISNVQQKATVENRKAADTSSTSHLHRNLEQSYDCTECKYTAKNKNSLKKHIQTHKRNGKFQCGTCQLTFTNKANCQRHVREIHGLHDKKSISEQIIFLKENCSSSDEKTIACRYCSGIFDNEQALQHHLRSNECKMKPYFCEICDIGSSTKNNCFRHIEKKHPELFSNEMTTEEKNKIKEQNMRQTIHISPGQANNNKSKEIEAAEGLCRLSENHQNETCMEVFSRSIPVLHPSCGTKANEEALQISGRTSNKSGYPMDIMIVTAGEGPGAIDSSVGVELGSSVSAQTKLSEAAQTCPSAIAGKILPKNEQTSPLITTKNRDFLEDVPLDLSINAIDLSFKSLKKADSPSSVLTTECISEGQRTNSESHGHPQPSKISSNNNKSVQQQKNAPTKQGINFRCKHCPKCYTTSSNLHRHFIKAHKLSSEIQLEHSHNTNRRVLLRECSINSSTQHSDDYQLKNSRKSLLINSKFNASYDRGTGSDTENDLASIPSIQSTVNQGIHIAHPYPTTMYSASHITRKRPFSDLQSSDSLSPALNPRKFFRVEPRSPREEAWFPVTGLQQMVSTSMGLLDNEESIGESPADYSGNNTSAFDLSESTYDQSFNARFTESAESSKDTDLVCCYCSSQFSSKEHVKSHIKELHYQEHNNTQEVPDEKIRWKKERFSKLRQ